MISGDSRSRGRRVSIRRSRSAKGALFLALFLCVFTGCTTKSGNDTLVVAGNTMGTNFTVKAVFIEVVADSLKPILLRLVQERLDEVDSTFSTYNPHSELSSFNKRGPNEAIEVSTEFARLFRLAGTIYRQSRGAFDPTAKPLVDLWGFGPSKRDRPPTPQEIADTKASIGYNGLTVDDAITKQRPLSVDMSAIAKGYGVDRVAELLEDLKASGYMVEVGGEVRTGGSRADGEKWRIGIEAPDPEDRRVHRTLDVGAVAIATSGDYRNYREENGQRLTHIIDPETGYPVDHRLASATVFHDDCASADAWATAMMVAGPDAGLELAEELSLAVLFLVKEEDGFREIVSSSVNQRFPKAFN